MIKYYTNPKTKTTYAVLKGCRFDAINKINKMMSNSNFGWYGDYEMPDTFKVKIKLAKNDVDDPELAKSIVKQKLMAKYYKCFDNRIDKFRNDLIQLNSKVFETPERDINKDY